MNGPCSIANFWIPKGYCEVKLLEGAPVWPPNKLLQSDLEKKNIDIPVIPGSCANSTIKKQNTPWIPQSWSLMFPTGSSQDPTSVKETHHFQQNRCPPPFRQETKNLSSDWNMPGQDAQVVARRFVVYLCHDHYDPWGILDIFAETYCITGWNLTCPGQSVSLAPGFTWGFGNQDTSCTSGLTWDMGARDLRPSQGRCCQASVMCLANTQLQCWFQIRHGFSTWEPPKQSRLPFWSGGIIGWSHR